MECKSITSNAVLFLENKRIEQAESNLTQPSDAINSALQEFWEVQDGSNDPSKQKELLYL